MRKLTADQIASIAAEIENPESNADFGVPIDSGEDEKPLPAPPVAKAKPTKKAPVLANAVAQIAETLQPVMEKAGPNPNLLRASDASDGFVFAEAIPFTGDSGYGTVIKDRAEGVCQRAFASIQSDFSNLPDFAPGNKLVVVVAVVEG